LYCTISIWLTDVNEYKFLEIDSGKNKWHTFLHTKGDLVMNIMWNEHYNHICNENMLFA
jgi:hypothetical protein